MNLKINSLFALVAFVVFISCSKTDPIPGVTNAISYKLDGTDYASPASFALTARTVLGATFTEVAITSVNNPALSLTFGFSNTTISGYVGLASNPVSIYDLTSLPNSAYKSIDKATGGTLTISGYDGTTLNGTFSFTRSTSGSSYAVTNGVLTNVKKI